MLRRLQLLLLRRGRSTRRSAIGTGRSTPHRIHRSSALESREDVFRDSLVPSQQPVSHNLCTECLQLHLIERRIRGHSASPSVSLIISCRSRRW